MPVGRLAGRLSNSDRMTTKTQSKISEAERDAIVELMTSRISEISEERYCAGWHHGIEFELWRERSDETESLHVASEMIGGWVYWEETLGRDGGARFCETQEFERLLEARSDQLRARGLP